MAKILFVDYWTRGHFQFRPIFERARAAGHECVLFHVRSFNDPSAPREETIDGLVARDISYYGTRDILTALRREGADVAVLLNTTLLGDRIFIRAFRHLGIRTVFLMHGLRATGDQLDALVADIDARISWRHRLSKVPKYASLCAMYLATVARTNAAELLAAGTYRNFFELLASPGRAIESPRPHKDLHCDVACVYSGVYRDLYANVYGYPKERVHVIGNPALDSAFLLKLRPDDPRVAATRSSLQFPADARFALYLEDAFVEQRLGGWTEETRAECLRNVARAAAGAGLKLVVKMHPGSHTQPTERLFADDPDVRVVRTADLAALIAASEVAIGHISTTLQTAICLEKPLLLCSWHPELDAFDYYGRTGGGVRCESPAALADALAHLDRIRASLAQTRPAYVERYLGPTDGRTWDRVMSLLFDRSSRSHPSAHNKEASPS